MARPLRVCWYAATPNFGDRISGDIVAQVSGRRVEHAGPLRADLFAIGSIMQLVAKASQVSGAKVTVWGSGLMGLGLGPLLHEAVEFAAVRGPLTQALMDLGNCAFGDPGLLAPRVLPPPPRDSDRIGLVFHKGDTPDPGVVARLVATGQVQVIDVTDLDHLGVVRQIASCRHIVSSSLHGLIIADAYGIPNTWMLNNRLHRSGRFKFFDHAAAIGRPLDDPVPVEAIPDLLARGALTGETPAYHAQVGPVQQRLVDAFPAALLGDR